jgi:hypothetical protein
MRWRRFEDDTTSPFSQQTTTTLQRTSNSFSEAVWRFCFVAVWASVIIIIRSSSSQSVFLVSRCFGFACCNTNSLAQPRLAYYLPPCWNHCCKNAPPCWNRCCKNAPPCWNRCCKNAPPCWNRCCKNAPPCWNHCCKNAPRAVVTLLCCWLELAC